MEAVWTVDRPWFLDTAESSICWGSEKIENYGLQRTIPRSFRQRRYGAQVGDLVENKCEWWFEAASGAEEVDGATFTDELLGLEAFAGRWVEGSSYGRISERLGLRRGQRSRLDSDPTYVVADDGPSLA